jgi:hypothetical protein
VCFSQVRCHLPYCACERQLLPFCACLRKLQLDAEKSSQTERAADKREREIKEANDKREREIKEAAKETEWTLRYELLDERNQRNKAQRKESYAKFIAKMQRYKIEYLESGGTDPSFLKWLDGVLQQYSGDVDTDGNKDSRTDKGGDEGGNGSNKGETNGIK